MADSTDMSSRERDDDKPDDDKPEPETSEPEHKKARTSPEADADDVGAVLAQLGGVFRACVRADGTFAARKYCSACCAGARMLARGVGTDTHADAWHATPIWNWGKKWASAIFRDDSCNSILFLAIRYSGLLVIALSISSDKGINCLRAITE